MDKEKLEEFINDLRSEAKILEFQAKSNGKNYIDMDLSMRQTNTEMAISGLEGIKKYYL